jgi:hypothetical protein
VSANKHRPHVLVLPEDDANRQIVTGFHLHVDPGLTRRLQVLPEAGGWMAVLNKFETEHVAQMDRFQNRLIVLVLDLDDRLERLRAAHERIPDRLKDRVFVVGALTDPESLRKSLGATYEQIGASLADECHNDQSAVWEHPLLRHNGDELRRLNETVRPILFG